MGEIMLRYVLNLQIFLRSNALIYVAAIQILFFLWNHGIDIFFISHLVTQTIGSHMAS